MRQPISATRFKNKFWLIYNGKWFLPGTQVLFFFYVINFYLPNVSAQSQLHICKFSFILSPKELWSCSNTPLSWKLGLASECGYCLSWTKWSGRHHKFMIWCFNLPWLDNSITTRIPFKITISRSRSPNRILKE